MRQVGFYSMQIAIVMYFVWYNETYHWTPGRLLPIIFGTVVAMVATGLIDSALIRRKLRKTAKDTAPR